MSVYNEPLIWLEESIISILNQTIPVHEFIIVNDNPGRPDLVRFLNDFEEKYSNVIVLLNSENKGLIYSLNYAIDKSTGDYIARMDADDVSLNNRFEMQVKYLNDCNLDLIGSNINFMDERGVKFSHSNKVLTNKYILKLLHRGVISIVHPTFFGRSSVFKDCLYNANALYAEDMEFLVNASSKGYVLGNCPEILLNCRYNNSSVTKVKTVQMENTVENIKYSFNNFKKTRNYNFIVNKDMIDGVDTIKGVLVKEYFSKARFHFSEKKYLYTLYFLMYAFFSSPVSFINSFKYRLMSNYYRFLEMLS